jgi:hypothetical protein
LLPNIESGIVNADNGGGNAPWQSTRARFVRSPGPAKTLKTPAVDNWDEVTLPQFPYLADIDG